jgi:hypothetical protein
MRHNLSSVTMRPFSFSPNLRPLYAAFSFDFAKPASESPICARPSGYLDALGTAETPQFQAR